MPQARRIVPADGVRPGRNRTGSDIAAKVVVKADATNVDGIALCTTAASEKPIGVTMAAIKNGENGDVQQSGRAVCTSGAAVTAGQRVTVAAGGKVIDAAPGAGANVCIVGVAVHATAGADEDVEVDLASPGTIMQGA